jgi:hypothetical protein
MVSLNSFHRSGTPLEAVLPAPPRLSRRSAGLSIIGLSLLSWAVVLVPLWAVIL